MFCFYVYHGKNRGAIFADSLDHAAEKFESVNKVKVTKVRNAHNGEMKKFNNKKAAV